MRILLNTHTFLWFLEDNTKVSTAVNDLLDDPANTKVLSIASLWEISIKVSIGRLDLANPYDETFPLSLTVNQIDVLSGASGKFPEIRHPNAEAPSPPILGGSD